MDVTGVLAPVTRRNFRCNETFVAKESKSIFFYFSKTIVFYLDVDIEIFRLAIEIKMCM